MPRDPIEVTYKPSDTARIPDALTEGATLLIDLLQRGVVKAVGQRLHIRRQGGYCALDVWLFLLLYFTSGTGKSVKAFWKLIRNQVLRLGALAGRHSLPSPAALTRALDATETALLRDVSPWLLAGIGEIDDVLRHPAMQTYDACGQAWHVFDLDPTVTTLRHRALPMGDDLPAPRRRSGHTGAPGHSGRKRGDIQFRRVTVQHAGSSAWLHAHLSPGNGEGVVDFERALNTVVQTCERLEHPLCRAMMRMDGEYGNVPWFSACRERNLPFVTRLNRPKLYEDRDVLARLRSAIWYRVPDSGSGPQRAAADLGVLTVHPGERTRRPDGERYDPVTIRVVATIFENTDKAKRGRSLDGWQVELFAVDLPAAAWPAPDAIAAYFGRNAEENRFAQEDRELGLDRIISYHLPGQELATLVGLSLWNLRVARGFEMAPPPWARPGQQPRCPQVDDRVAERWPRDPVVLTVLAEMDWPVLLSRRPGWYWDSDTAELRCQEGRGLTLTSVRPVEHADGRTGIIFRRPRGGCEDCSSRQTCCRSARQEVPKHAEFAVSTFIADQLRRRLALVRAKPSGPRSIEPLGTDPGPYTVADSLFLPASARQIFAEAFLGATIRVDVELPPPGEPRPRLIAVDIGDRQRRRKTWTQNVERYALPDEAKVRVEVAGSATLRQMLGEHPSTRMAAGAGG